MYSQTFIFFIFPLIYRQQSKLFLMLIIADARASRLFTKDGRKRGRGKVHSIALLINPVEEHLKYYGSDKTNKI